MQKKSALSSQMGNNCSGTPKARADATTFGKCVWNASFETVAWSVPLISDRWEV